MTPREMQISFIQYFESSSIPLTLESDDIFMWLNLSQDEFLKTRFSPLNIQRSGFEQSQERIDDLSTLVVSDSLKDAEVYNSANVLYSSFFADLVPYPVGYLHLIGVKANIRYNIAAPADITILTGPPDVRQTVTNNEPTKIVNCRISQADDINKLLDDPFNKPTHKSPIAVFDKTGIIIYCDDTFIILDTLISFIKIPVKIVLTSDGAGDVLCELPPFLHREIVDMAIRMYGTNSGRLVPQENI